MVWPVVLQIPLQRKRQEGHGGGEHLDYKRPAIHSKTPYVTGSEVKCPRCGSEAIYRYGRTHNGKRRFICVLCRRQFSVGAKRYKVKDRPDCPQCGRPMHIYKREKGCIRFRCSAYPQCRTYKKIVVEQE
ncbi:MAG: topoisomerase DNA-binding C4 zinc finger domain-containing protein [Thermodesulfobacteriota bacterium]|nr:topoisomerase DNA-binding C4 zinc finger domain-containing protein [Thermodesulfobacteriota bacterium]